MYFDRQVTRSNACVQTHILKTFTTFPSLIYFPASLSSLIHTYPDIQAIKHESG